MLKLVLLPGMDGTGDLFSEFIAALPETLETVTVRYPTAESLPYSDLENFVRAACPISDPFVLVAESFSTPLAIKYAATRPPNLKGIVLCAGFARRPVQSWRCLLSFLLAPLVFRLPLSDFAARRWLTGPDAPASLLKAVRIAISSVRPNVLAARLRAVLACEVCAQLNQIEAPMLYIQAKRDRLVNASSLNVIHEIKPRVAVTVLDGPHLILQQEPQRTAEAVLGFLESSIQAEKRR